MKKFAAIISCFLLVFGFCTPALAASASPSDSITISDNVLYLTIFIAFVVVFFVLGLILGMILGPPSGRKKTENTATAKKAKDKLTENLPVDNTAQDTQNRDMQPTTPRYPRNRYYNY